MTENASDPLDNAFVRANLLGQSPCFLATLRKIEKISRYDVGVYIYGETGTGKELTARAIHYLSARGSGPFIPLSCGGLSDDLLLNELFGHAKGAYTGADTTQQGVIQMAHKGTLFLDEIDSLTPKAQVALLRFLQQKEFKLLGSADIQHADIRIISAGNRDLAQCVKAGAFRHDLLYRLNILRIDLPPLRQREKDVLLLARHFIHRFQREFQIDKVVLEAKVVKWLESYDWPGNVRELENYMLKLCLLSELPDLTPFDQRGSDQNWNFEFPPKAETQNMEGFNQAKARAVNRFEKQYLQWLLTKTAGNVSHAAVLAQKERRTFTRLLKKHQIQRSDYLP